MKKKVLMMVLAMTVLAGCGAKEATPTDAGVSDTKVEASTEEVVVDEQDNQEVVQEVAQEEVASDTEQVTEEPAVEESSLPENPTEEDFSYPYLYDISRECVDDSGNTLSSVSSILDEIYTARTLDNKVLFDKEFEYVDINGERWLQMTVHVPEGAMSYLGYVLPEQGSDFVIAYSPDFFKVMHNGVVYSATQDYIDFKKQYSPYAKDYDEGICLNRAYDDAGNILY